MKGNSMSDLQTTRTLRLDSDEAVTVIEYGVGVDGKHLAIVEIDGDLEYEDGLGSLRLAVETSRLVVAA